jgi:flavin-dependent dehydrogenase
MMNQTLYDCEVAICGGGLAGLTLARQLKQQMPGLAIVVLDKLARPLPEAAFKVGESTTEAGAYYLAETLGLKDYLSQSHLYKLGFRFFFGDARGPFQDRPEFGLSEFPVVPSFNVDRGLLENDLRKFNAEAGIIMLEGCAVRDIALSNDDDRHEVSFVNGNNGVEGKIRARWVVDAMGRRRFIQKKLNLLKPLGKDCSAVWFRLRGRIDVSDLVPHAAEDWHRRVPNNNRFYSTNHLMGRGYWVWIIPLPSDSTSIGIVALEEIHPFSEFNTYESALRWLKKFEPVFAAYIEGCEPLDFMCMRKYSYSSRQVFSFQRWACVGEAGAFSDPLYAPATDLIGIANSMTTEMIRLDCAGKLTPEIVRNYNFSIIALNDALTRNIQVGYPLFSNAVVVAAKIIWDTAAGWALLAPQIYNSIFVDEEKQVKVRKAKASYFLLAQTMHRLFVEWEAKSSGRGTFEFIDFLRIPLLLELRQRNLQGGKSAEELVDDHIFNMEKIEELAQSIFLLAVEDVMPERLQQFQPPIWLNAWGASLNPEKWQADKLFEPASQPRDLSGVRKQIRSLFRFKNN